MHQFRVSLYPFATNCDEYLNLTQQVENVRINLAKREVQLVVRDDCYGQAAAFIGEFARLHDRNQWTLAIGVLDRGSDNVMHAKIFDSAHLLDHELVYDYAQSGSALHVLTITYKVFSILNEDNVSVDDIFSAYDRPKDTLPVFETPSEAMDRIYREAVHIAENRLTPSDI
jgi:hypothetical protein